MLGSETGKCKYRHQHDVGFAALLPTGGTMVGCFGVREAGPEPDFGDKGFRNGKTAV